MLLVALTFSGIPFYIYFGEFYGFEKEPRFFPALVSAAILFPFIYLTIKNSLIIKIKLLPVGIQVSNALQLRRRIYAYDQVDKIDLKAYRIERYTNPRYGKTTINFDERIIIHFKNGHILVIAAETYSNYKELSLFINDRKEALIQT
ncbi:MAG TPA: hypothetical protein VK174_18490 [Chitinophagales bacterium]|nr:hypothetical protein [Chitinophagales bacterium]